MKLVLAIILAVEQGTRLYPPSPRCRAKPAVPPGRQIPSDRYSDSAKLPSYSGVNKGIYVLTSSTAPPSTGTLNPDLYNLSAGSARVFVEVLAAQPDAR